MLNFVRIQKSRFLFLILVLYNEGVKAYAYTIHPFTDSTRKRKTRQSVRKSSGEFYRW